MSARGRLLGDNHSSDRAAHTYLDEPDFSYNTFDDSYIKVKRMPRICGPKLSNCCFVLSIWGMIMLVLMGIFFRMESVALLEDIPQIATNGSKAIKDRYGTASMNCFVAAGIYAVVFFLSMFQKIAINRGYKRLF